MWWRVSGLVLRYVYLHRRNMARLGEILFWPVMNLLLWGFLLIQPFAAVFYPIDVFPPWLQILAGALPPSYVFESMRAVLRTGNADPLMLLTALGLNIVIWRLVRGYLAPCSSEPGARDISAVSGCIRSTGYCAACAGFWRGSAAR